MMRQTERAVEQFSKFTALLFFDLQVRARASENAAIEPGITNLANGQHKTKQVKN
jgi:hypothetical protein